MSPGNGPEADARASRRQFFREFGRQTVSNAGSVLAGVDALRRSSQDAFDGLLDDAPTATRERMPAGELQALPGERPTGPDAPFQSPYRVTDRAIEILDQRELPGRVVTVDCAAATEVAAAIGGGLVSGGPVLGQLAAYAVVLAAEHARDRPEHARRAAIEASAETLRGTRPTSRAIAAALERIDEVAHVAEEADDGDALRDALRAAADAIAYEAALDHARIGQLGAEALAEHAPRASHEERPLALLMHGDLGPLVGGQVGPGVAIVQVLAARELPVELWLTEAAPLDEGRRAAWQLRAFDLPHTLLPDTALAWLLANRPLDAVIVRAETLCANGDVVAPLGSLAAAHLARAAGVRVLACAPLTAFDPAAASGTALPPDWRAPIDPADAARSAPVPAADVIPAGLIDGVLSDEGLLVAPLAEALAVAAGARERRHSRPAVPGP